MEAAKIEPEGTQSKHNTEPAQNPHRPAQNLNITSIYGTRKPFRARARKHIFALSGHKRNTSQRAKVVRYNQTRATANAQRPGQSRGRMVHSIGASEGSGPGYRRRRNSLKHPGFAPAVSRGWNYGSVLRPWTRRGVKNHNYIPDQRSAVPFLYPPFIPSYFISIILRLSTRLRACRRIR